MKVLACVLLAALAGYTFGAFDVVDAMRSSPVARTELLTDIEHEAVFGFPRARP